MNEKWSHEKCLEHWIYDSQHEDYIAGKERSNIVVELIDDAGPNPGYSILELGCNVGRNLHYLLRAGYTKLYGIDVSPRTVTYMKYAFPDVANIAKFYEGTIEERIVEFGNDRFDIVFSLAVH